MPVQSWHAPSPTCHTLLGSITAVARFRSPSRETQGGLSFLDQHVVVAALAQQGVLGLEQICALGITASTVRQRASAGRLHRVFHAVYSIVPPALLARDGWWMAAVLACGPGAVLSHRSAGALHALRPFNGTKIDVTVPRRFSLCHDGVTIHRSTTLTEADATVVDGIPCTTVARTLFDLADVTGRRGLERAFDQSESLEVFDLLAMQDQLERNTGRRRASGLVKVVLNEHYIGTTPTWNDFEERLLAISRPLDIPDPDVNQWLILRDGGPPIRPDFMWRDQRLIIETDGHETHGTGQAFETDRRRDQRLTLAGWRVIRITWRQLFRRPHEVRELLRRLWNR
jgi:predicted transcriptional regulator of viral defense system